MAEWFVEYEFNRPRTKGDYAGKLTKGVVDELMEFATDGAS